LPAGNISPSPSLTWTGRPQSFVAGALGIGALVIGVHPRSGTLNDIR
jgi:hypothetical protein